MSKPKEKEIFKYTGIPGVIKPDDNIWNDYNILGKDFFKNKIINIKIYFGSGKYSKKEEEKDKIEIFKGEETEEKDEIFEGEETEEKDIIGISLIYKNLVTGKITSIEHKGSETISGMEEIKLDSDEFIIKYIADFDHKIGTFLTLGFSTNKKRQIIIGKKDNPDVYFNSEDEKSIIAGTFGYLKEKIHSLGCLYFEKKIILKYDLFRFIFLRYLIKKDEQFKKRIDKEIESFEIEYKYMWRFLNLPDTPFSCIIKFCSF